MNWLHALLLGIVEGLTEFVPVSSTGHLIMVSDAMNLNGDFVDSFNVAIQSGAIAAVLVIYRRRFFNLFRPAMADDALSGSKGWLLLGATSLPVLTLGFFFVSRIKDLLFHPITVASALAVGGLAMILIEKYHRQQVSLSENTMTLRQAFWIGCFQCLALWPGMSRSASTIIGSRFLGFDRETAARYSFMAAIPVLFAATAYELVFHPEVLAQGLQLFALGFITAFITAWFAVKTFLWLLGRYTLAPYGWYRLVLAAGIGFFWYLNK